MVIAALTNVARTILLAICAVAFAMAIPTAEAWAQARHERVTVTAVKAKGKVVGARIKAVMRPADGYNRVQLVLGKAKPGQFDGTTYRQAAAGQTKGYVLHEGPKSQVTKNAEPVEFVVKFNAKNGLKPGDKVDLTSVWAKGEKFSMNPSAPDALHVWGMTRNGYDREITLPSK